MIIVQHTPAASGGQGEMDESFDFTKEFETERARLFSLLIQAELPTTPNGPFVKVTSIFFQEFEGLSSPPPEHPVQVRFMHVARRCFAWMFLTQAI
jgi:tRNA (uracil-5-)-methyltransferase